MAPTENDEIRMTKREGTMNDQVTNDRASFVIRHSCFIISLMLIFQACCIASTQAQSLNLIGSWNVEITFANATRHSLRFDAQGAGKGTLLLLDPRSTFWEPAKGSEAKWSQGDQNVVTFSGAVEFPIGNVGRDPGTLVFKGKFDAEGSIAGEVEFSPLVGEGPSKSGTFKAIRAK
jgi:hypothetical protein